MKLHRYALGGLAVLITSCQGGNSLIAQAQARFDADLEGRACTSLTRQYYVADFEEKTDEFLKLSVLERHGLVKLTPGEARGVKVTYAEPLSAPGVTVINDESAGARYFCFGQWTVTDAKLAPEHPAPAGQQVASVTYKLTDAPEWISTDPQAALLSAASRRGDLARMFDTAAGGVSVPASYTKSNTMLRLLTKP